LLLSCSRFGVVRKYIYFLLFNNFGF
jgi:hypothetical protein